MLNTCRHLWWNAFNANFVDNQSLFVRKHPNKLSMKLSHRKYLSMINNDSNKLKMQAFRELGISSLNSHLQIVLTKYIDKNIYVFTRL